jgi:hypothetical protein
MANESNDGEEYDPENPDIDPNYYIEVEFSVSPQIVIADLEQEEEFLTAIRGEVRHERTKKSVGVIEATYVHVDRAVAAGMDLYTIFDTDAGLFEFWEPLKPISDRYVNLCSGESGDLLIIEALGIEPAFRGRTTGGHVIRRTVITFGQGCGLIAGLPSPSTYEGGRFNYLDKPAGASTLRLRSYFKKLGFRQLGKAAVMVAQPAAIMASVIEGPTRGGES